VLQGCEGLADAIEQQWQHSDDSAVRALCEKYIHAMGAFGSGPGQLDTLVLGCTHYPFAMGILRGLVGEAVEILETGEPVARQTFKVLKERGLLVKGDWAVDTRPGSVELVATGDATSLQHAAHMWLSN
jgi:glutamate racemase